MFTQIEHLENLVRHKELVKDAAVLLGKRLIYQGRVELGRQIIERGFAHDNSKFFGIEWQYLHAGKDVPKDVLDVAIGHHRSINAHHPEHHGGLIYMDQTSVAEMVCDWYARSQEFGTGLRQWISSEATEKFKLDSCPTQATWITEFVSILLEDVFNRE